MKKYFYNYQTIIHFSSPVSRHFFRLRCMPCENTFQQAEKRELFLHPADFVSHDTDAFGNPVQYGSRLDTHDAFLFVSSGTVCQTPYIMPCNDADGDMFKTRSSLTAATAEMRALASDVCAGGGSALDKALRLSQEIYSRMTYMRGTTQTETNAATAFGLCRGVCQDYAHILLSLCRSQGIAARYANGFIQGVGETHAWAEILDGDVWRGIDPTNNQLIEYGYIKLSHGRDAMDCPVNRGVFTGAAAQRVEVRVIAEEI